MKYLSDSFWKLTLCCLLPMGEVYDPDDAYDIPDDDYDYGRHYILTYL